jgi:peptidoglycan/xylan/chitin deacetylase (PgdA/CDA1 family)
MMSGRARAMLAFVIRWCGPAALIRALVARRRVSILLYHDPDPRGLDRQLAYLSRRYNPISLDSLVNALDTGTWSEIPPRGIVITIDDGLASNRELLDVFQRHGVVPTIFLCSQLIGTTRHLWFEHVDPAAAGSLKWVSNSERLETLARDHGFEQTRQYPDGKRQALNAAEVAEMRVGCEFGSHTRFHPILPSCSTAEAAGEVTGSKAEIESLIGVQCNHFAYPNGCYTEREVGLARDAGYASARTVDIGWNGPRTDPYKLRILGVEDGSTVTTMVADLAGLYWLGRLFRREGTLGGEFRLRPGT